MQANQPAPTIKEIQQIIIDFFRCYQENQELFTPLFSPEQIDAIKDGRLPAGRL
jgi:hypothetical protein